jgi:iron(III) transport system permease protein
VRRFTPFSGYAYAGAALTLAPVIGILLVATSGADPEVWRHIVRYVLPVSVRETALLLAGVGTLTAIAGTGCAYLVTNFAFPARRHLLVLLPLPLAIPTYIVAYVYADLLETLGPVQSALRAVTGWQSASDYWFPQIRSLGGAIFVMSFVLYPYVYLGARAMFQTQSAIFADSARVLGATRGQIARDILLPLSRPAISVGLSLALLETLNDIGASEYLGVRTLTLSIFTTWLNRGSLAGAAQISCGLLIIVIALVWLERYGRRARNIAFFAAQARPAMPMALRGWRAALATAACLTPVTIGFLVPLFYLTHEAVARGLLTGFDFALVRHALTSIGFAAAATAVALIIGLGTAAAVRDGRNPVVAAAANLPMLGYAMPGTVLALGLLTPLVGVDRAINALTQAVAGIDVGLVFAGSAAAVILAYATRFLTVAGEFLKAGMARIPAEFDEVARAAGARRSEILWSIQLPLLRPALWGAALLVFVDCLKELPATLLLRPLNVETLSTYIYQFATRGNFEDGALAALMIVLAGIIPVTRIVRYAEVAMAPEVLK